MKKTQNKSRSKSLTYWLCALFILNGLYLVYELAFNARLVDVSVSRLTDSEVHALELEGRFLSGIGLSLLCLRLISISNVSFVVAAGKVMLAIAIAFPFMFFGQKILVDHMVNRTTSEQRLNAQHLTLLKTGLANNALSLEGIEFDSADLDSAHTRTFLSILGLMTFVSPDFISALKEDSERIINQVAENEASKALPESYEAYISLQEAINEAWQKYKRVSDAYWTEVAKLPSSAAATWNTIQQELLIEWQQVQSQQDAGSFTRSVLLLQRNLENYFEARSECSNHRLSDECVLKVEEIYTEEITNQLGRYVAPSEWCHSPETVAVTVQRRGRFVVEQQQRQQCRDLSYDHLAERLSTFTRQPTSYQEFLQNDEVNTQLRLRILEDGLDIPANWRANDRDAFIASYIAQKQAGLEEAFDNSLTKEFGSTLPMDLNARQFVESVPIQSRLHEALRPLDTSLMVTLDMSPTTFRDLIIKPRYVAYAQAELTRLQGEASLMGNGEVLEEEGKRYVRGLIVPPIAMGFSLFFALVNGVGFLASIPVLFGIKSLWFSLIVKVGGLVAVILTPMIYQSTVVSTTTYRYFEEETAKSLTPIGGLFSTWVINTQPIIYNHSSFITVLVPPLFPADVEQVEAERAGANTVDDGRTQTGTAQSDSQRQKPVIRVHATRLENEKVFSIDTRMPVYPQLEENSLGFADGVMIDVQQLADLTWVLHYEPIISGEGTCLTSTQQALQLRNMSSAQWRAARHGSCTNDSISFPSIPQLADFTSNFKRLVPRATLWVHYQPSLLHEVNCHSVRSSAQSISEQLGKGRLVAAVSNEQMLSCFAITERDFRVAYIGPQYGANASLAPKSARHLSRADVIRLRERAGGVGYREFTTRLGVEDLRTMTRDLRENDILLIQPQHVTAELEVFAQGFTGTIGLYSDNFERYKSLLDSYQITVIRE